MPYLAKQIVIRLWPNTQSHRWRMEITLLLLLVWSIFAGHWTALHKHTPWAVEVPYKSSMYASAEFILQYAQSYGWRVWEWPSKKPDTLTKRHKPPERRLLWWLVCWIFVQNKKNNKNNLYLTAAKARHATFTPIIATWDAVFNKDSELSCKTLG